jgi:hypothetical protein
VLHQEHQGFASTLLAATGSSNTVDVIIRIIWGVVLDDPVNFREVKTSLSHIGAKQDSGLSLTELKVSARSFLLFLLSVDVFDGDVDVVQQVGVKLDSIAGRHKHHNFLLQVFAKESEQKLEFASWVDYNVALLETCICACLAVF